MPSFNNIILTILNGGEIKSSLLVPYLCAESLSERLEINLELGKAYDAAGNIKQARVFIERAWLFSQFSEDILPVYEEIVRKSGDFDALREAYKRVGISKAKNEGIGAALPYFFKSMYVYANNGKGDLYKFDFEILEELGRLAEPFRFSPILQEWKPWTRKLRIAYLVFGVTQAQSIVVKILRDIGQYHNRQLFDFAFFIPENELIAFSNFEVLRSNIKNIEMLGNPVVVTNGGNSAEALLEISKRIFDYSPDIMVTSALLADLKQYYIAALRPAPVIIGLTHGPPQQFSSPLLDWSISWDTHTLMDCMSGCSHVPLEVDLPSVMGVFPGREFYGIPHDAIVLTAAGRSPKFLNRSYWQAIAAVVAANEKVFLMIIGLMEKPPFFDGLFTGDFAKRVRIFGWSPDYINLLRISDIMIDTYPSGGGGTIMDAMALGLPVVTFKNNYMQLFDQTNWSPGECIVDVPELCAERDNWSDFSRIVSQLIDDEDYRVRMGGVCKSTAIEKRGSPTRMVRRIERIYIDVFSKVSKSIESPHDHTVFACTKPNTDEFKAVIEERINFWRFQEKFLQSDAVRLTMFLARFPFITRTAKTLIKFFRKWAHETCPY